MRTLRGRVAVVTGSSRGAGRGIALALGEAGATVYVTGRSRRGGRRTDGVPGTIEDTADEVSRRGGRGIAVRCDHAVDRDVAALFRRVRREQGRLDLLVNNAWGGYESPGLSPAWFWKTPFERLWRGMFVAGVRAHMLAAYHAIPLMLPRRRGLIVSTVAWNRDLYLGSLYDVSKHAIVRMIWGLAKELRRHRIAAVAVAPGFMRTERVLKRLGTDEAGWRNVPALRRTESPEYVGRAVVALASDPRVLRRSGKVFRVGDLARAYGFTDVDGRRVPPFSIPKSFERLLEEWERPARGRRRFGSA
jgi:NAD(P)-dependent dehydrogenase (short-subunit alcohol dehydrogenase family)